MNKAKLGEWLPLLLDEIDRKHGEAEQAREERDRRLREAPETDGNPPDAPTVPRTSSEP